MKVKSQAILIIFFYSIIFFLTNYFSESLKYLEWTLFTLGLVIGVILMALDEFVLYKYYLDPIKSDESAKSSDIKLITRSLLFIISLIPLGIFIITSTGSEMGIGLFLGIITILLIELISFRKNINSFHKRFLSQLKIKLSAQEVKYFVAIFSFFTMIFVLLTFFFGR